MLISDGADGISRGDEGAMCTLLSPIFDSCNDVGASTYLALAAVVALLILRLIKP